ncbi:MAG: stage II sporulation protein M [Eubacteriales bacterium]|nr:stage II sporulation protein M [Eubacteriales bacterium]
MKQGALSFSDVRRVRDSPAFVFSLAFLLCGLLAGSFTGMHIPQNDGTYMNSLAELLTQSPAMLSWKTVLSCIGCVAAWPLAAVILGSGPGRGLWIALLIAIRGFLLSFAVAAILQQSGLRGIYLSAATTGVMSLFALPALLLLASAALMAGQSAGRNGYWKGLRQYTGTMAVSLLLLLAAALWRLFVTPMLLSIVGI